MKYARKVISLILILCMSVFFWPESVYTQIAMGSTAYAYLNAEESSYEHLALNSDVYEIVELREENVKHFHLEDGTSVAVMYDDPVHYMDESGQWQDIDNTLSSSGSEFSNPNARIKFAKKITGNETLFTLHDGNAKITMSLNGAIKKVAGKVTNLTTEFESDATKLQKLMTLDKLSSRIIYEDILEGVDLEYVVDSLNVKENIIVKQKNNSYEYVFTLSLNNLEAELLEDGSVRIYSVSNNRTVYSIPKGYMYDANGEVSYAVDYEIEKLKNGDYEFTVKADENWINGSDRAFPVTIDPSVGVTNTTVSTATTMQVSSSATCYWQTSSLPSIPDSSIIVSATISLYRTSGNGVYVGAYNRTTSAGAIGSQLYDFNNITSTSNAWYTWNITKLVKLWYSGTANYGVGFKAVPNTTVSGTVTFARSSDSANRPSFIVTYKDVKGVESYWTYLTQGAGLAGSGHINVATGSLTLSKGTVSTTDSLLTYMPTLVYNSYMAGKVYNSSTAMTARTTGYMPYGFMLSMDESVLKVKYYDSTDTLKYYYIFSDSDGTEHAFNEISTNVYMDEDGLQLKLNTSNSSKLVITDANHISRNFIKIASDSSSDVCERWILDSIQDATGNEMVFSYDSSKDYRPTEITLFPIGTTGIITYIKILYNSAGRPSVIWNVVTNDAVVFKYSSTYSGSISSTTGNYLRQVIHAHGLSGVTETNWNNYYTSGTTTNIKVVGTASYTYNSAGYITSAKDEMTNYRIDYNYSSGKITSVYEYGGTTTGQSISISYGDSYTEVRTSGNNDYLGDSDDILNRYVYDICGRVVTAYSTDLNRNKIYGASSGAYESEIVGANNNLKIASTIESNSANYIFNGGFENSLEYWTTTGTVSIGTGMSNVNTNSARMTVSASSTSSVYQYVFLYAGTYTLAADISSNAKNMDIWLKAESISKNANAFSEKVSSDDFYDNDNKKGFAYLTFTVANVSNGGEVFKISISATGKSNLSGSKYAEIDNVMLSLSDGAQSMNLVYNGDFENTSATSSGAVNKKPSDIWSLSSSNVSIAAEDSTLFHNVLKITGGMSLRSASQTIYSAGSGNTYKTLTDDVVLTISGFGRATDILASSLSVFAIIVEVSYYGNSETVRFDFCKDTGEWQYVCGNVVIPAGSKLSKISVKCEYSYNTGTAFFDNISIKDSSDDNVSQYYYYADGKLKHQSTGKNISYYVYDKNTGDISYIITNTGKTVYTYDNLSRLLNEKYYTYSGTIVYSDMEKTILESALGTLTLSQTTEYTYDSNGLITKSKITFGSSGKYVQSENTYYTTSGNKIYGAIKTSTDSFGKVTRYFYDETNGRLLAVIQPDGNGTCYTYDEIGNLITVQPAVYSTSTGKWSSSSSAKVSYTYNTANQLSTIVSGGVTYTLSYDVFGDNTSIKIGSTEIVKLTKNSRNGKVSSITYANGVTIKYEYDELDRVSKITYNSGSTVQGVYEYDYDANGNLNSVTDVNQKRRTLYKYNMSGMLMSTIEVDESTSENLLKAFYSYDSKSRISVIHYAHEYTVSSSTYGLQHEYAYSYNSSEQLSSLAISIYSATSLTYDYSYFMRIEPTYDTVGRVTSKSTKVTNASNTSTSFEYKTGYTYKDSGSAASYLVSKYTYQINSGTITTFNYVYDSANINITQISDASGTVQYQYTYDALGRLTREDNRPANRTYVYTYDTNGNILTKITYGFTLTSGTPTTTKYSTNTYTYGNSSWKDQLTSFNGTALTYDNIGNPTKYYNGTNTMTFTWIRGRELSAVVNGSNSISYTYGASGMRISKTVNGVVHTYIYDGSTLISEEYGGKQLVFIYDENGSPIGFKYRESTWAISKFDTYIYAKNLQGDVVAIYNDAGTLVTQYVYDAWGNILSTTGNFASTIGTINPIRYRGYYYDTETGFYYLQSRYYDPAIGRFISADSYIFQNFQGFNLYVYCFNNPVNYIDTCGENAEAILEYWSIFGLSLTFADGFLPVGDIIYVAGIVVLSLFVTADEQTNDVPNSVDPPKNIEDATDDNQGEKQPPEVPNVKYPGDDPTVPPGEGYEWRGKQPVGGKNGSWYNPKTEESWHPDLNHGGEIEGHWDYNYKKSGCDGWRVFPDGRVIPK